MSPQGKKEGNQPTPNSWLVSEPGPVGMGLLVSGVGVVPAEKAETSVSHKKKKKKRSIKIRAWPSHPHPLYGK